ncbi:MAG: cell wall metabolism sensor histidine kinase WalK [Deltaproteobacteria bacterium]|nr:cell wall metabolism sensor histidine kinase WalK [Deltaproteobacteria bacterium]
MKLFQKTFVSVLIPFVVVISFVSYFVSIKQISDAERNVIEEHRTISRFLSKEIEVGYFELKWPFENLKQLSQHEGFLFWWIVRDDGTIHLADNATFIGTHTKDYFPDITSGEETEAVFLNRKQNYGIFVHLLEIGNVKWAFWHGCSMIEVSNRKKEIIFLTSILSLSALVIFGSVLYFAMKHFTKPIKQLSVSAAMIGKWDFTNRVEVKSRDELGELADSFNKMAVELEKTGDELVAAKEYTDNIVNSMMNSLIVVSPEGKIQYVNPVTCSLLGYEKNEIVGQHIGIIFEEEEEEEEEEPFKGSGLANLIKKGVVNNLEKTYLSKDGRKIPVLFSMSIMREKDNTPQPPLLDITPPSPPLILRGGREGLRGSEEVLPGKIQGIVCVAQNITERKRAEEAQKKLIHELEDALSQVKQLKGLLPICMYCKKIRKDENYWQAVESYITEHSEAIFSHGVCPECEKKYIHSQLEELDRRGKS